MFKNYYVNKFLKENLKFFENNPKAKEKIYDIYQILLEMPNCTRILHQISKLPSLEHEKIISIIKNYKNCQLSSKELDIILSDCINLINNGVSSTKLPHLEKLYYACGKNEVLYHSLVSDLKECYTSRKYLNLNLKITSDMIEYNVPEYINILIKNRKWFRKILNSYVNTTLTVSNFTIFPPDHLEKLITYHENNSEKLNEYKLEVLKHLPFYQELALHINDMSAPEFLNVLRCLLTVNSTSIIRYRLSMIEKIMTMKGSITVKELDIVSVIPDYLMSYVGNTHIKSFIEFLDSSAVSRTDIQNLQKTCPKNENLIKYRLFSEELFYQLFPNTQKLIIQKVGKSDQPCDQAVEVAFDLQKTYFRDINNEEIEYQTFRYILEENDSEILIEKKHSIQNIQSELMSGDMTSDMYGFYLHLLNANLKGKNVEEKSKFIRARSTYFQSHDFINLYWMIQDSTNQKQILQLLKTSDNCEIMNERYQFVEYSDSYSKKIVDKIIQKLSDAQSITSTKAIMNKIDHPSFIKASKKKQEKELKLIPIQVERLRSTSQLEIIVKDSLYVEDQVKKNKYLEFENPKTGLKIIMKRRKNGKKN